VKALDGGLFDCAVYALDLTVCSRMAGLSETVLNVVFCADAVKQVEQGPGLAAHVAKLDAVVSQHCMDSIG